MKIKADEHCYGTF